jgi:hypothetical protein
MKFLLRFLLILIALNFFVLCYSLFVREKAIPNEKVIGWPYVYYTHFKLSGSNEFNHGWNEYNFLYDQLIFCLVSFCILIIFFRLKTK